MQSDNPEQPRTSGDSNRLGRGLRFGYALVRSLPALLLRPHAPRHAAAMVWYLLHGDFGGAKTRLIMAAGLIHADPDAKAIAHMRAALGTLPQRPLFSILMPTYNTQPSWLRRAIDSILAQTYPDWELCVADDASTAPEIRLILGNYAARDPRIKVQFRPTNSGIAAASNTALAMATGDFIALVDHDDELRQDALFHIACEINRHPDAELIYSDEDKINARGYRCDPYFKPDWNYDLFLSHNLITHLAAYRTARVREIGGFRSGFEGAQDYDLALRFVIGLPAGEIRHIPRLLYHWRQHAGSTAYSPAAKAYAPAAARRAIAEHLRTRGIDAEVLPAPGAPQCHRVKYLLPNPPPLVTVIIPTRNRIDLLKPCVESILSRTAYAGFDILIIDNGSDEPETIGYLDSLAAVPRITIRRDNRSFNFSALMNAAVAQARGEVIILMNNDIEAIDNDWLSEMVSHAVRPEIGAVGARLWYPDFTLQHGGIVLGIGAVAGHAHKRLRRGLHGHAHRAILIQDFSAVTGACLAVRKAVYREVGGLDETLAVAFNDVDFCLRVGAVGYRVLWTPYAELVHHESASRGYDTTSERQERIAKEAELMKVRWGKLLEADPAYNPNLTHERQDFSYAWPARLLDCPDVSPSAPASTRSAQDPPCTRG
jgi:glycosyltransferase involved in cell wall biosynthesis